MKVYISCGKDNTIVTFKNSKDYVLKHITKDEFCKFAKQYNESDDEITLAQFIDEMVEWYFSGNWLEADVESEDDLYEFGIDFRSPYDDIITLDIMLGNILESEWRRR